MAIPKPITRVEQYLAHISGMRVNVPEAPLTREERYLAAWAKKSGIEDAEIQGDPPLTLKDCIGEPFKGLVLYGKSTQVTTTGAQLLKLVDREPVTICGLTWQIKNQCISVNGTATDEGNVTDFYICGARDAYADVDFPEGEITISADLPKDIVMYVVKRGTTLTYIASNKKDGSFEHISGSKYRILLRAMKKGAIYDNVIKAMLNTGSTALPWEPYTGGKPSPSPDYPQEIVSAGDDGSIGIEVHGKNIFGGRYYYANYANSILIINGNKKGEEVKLPYAPEYESFGVCKVIKCRKGKTYIISVTNPNKNAVVGMAEYETIEKAIDSNNALGFVGMCYNALKKSYIAKSDGILVCGIAGSWTDGKTTLHECTESELLQVEESMEVTDYKPYRLPQTLTITSPTSLPGIPVDSDGNYTDSTGQQWICDEVDFERGVYVQRIGKTILPSNSTLWIRSSEYEYYTTIEKNKYEHSTTGIAEKLRSHQKNGDTLNNIFVNANGNIRVSLKNSQDTTEQIAQLLGDSSFFAVLATPIETPLSETDIAAYRALTTYKGTTILESECYLKVKYSKLRK